MAGDEEQPRDRADSGGTNPYFQSADRAANERPIQKFSVDNPGVLRLLAAMAQPAEKLTSPVSLVVDAVLLVAFFLYLYSVVSTHVPSANPKWVMFWGAMCAGCMTGVFWLAVQMFRVVLRAQLAARKK